MTKIVVIGAANTGKTTAIHTVILDACKNMGAFGAYDIKPINGKVSESKGCDLRHKLNITSKISGRSVCVAVYSQGDSRHEVGKGEVYGKGCKADIVVLATREKEWVNGRCVKVLSSSATTIVDLRNALLTALRNTIGR